MITQKATILCVYEILKTYTDENHILPAEKIREKLKLIYDVDMERRAVYRNIEALRSMGIEIEGYRENREGYYLAEREFELPEIRLLCDAVAGSDMIKEETGKTMIKKLIGTQSIFQGRMLQKTVFVKSGKKTWNKQLFYNIDALNVAINQGCKVKAKLMEFSFDHGLKERTDSPAVFSPYATIWAEGNYYILAKREEAEGLEHFRIDLIKDIEPLERGVDMVFGSFNPGEYARRYILEHGEHREVYTISCREELWQKLEEVFGADAEVMKKEGTEISVKISAVPSAVRSWVLEHLDECDIISPKKFREEIQTVVQKAWQKYWR